MAETRSTSIRLSDATREELKKFVYEHKFVNQDDAIKFLLKAADFTQAASSMPIRQQTLNDIGYHMERIMDLIKSLFKSYGDMAADYERQLAEKDEQQRAEIEALVDRLNAYKNATHAAETPAAADADSTGDKEPPAELPAVPVESHPEPASINILK